MRERANEQPSYRAPAIADTVGVMGSRELRFVLAVSLSASAAACGRVVVDAAPASSDASQSAAGTWGAASASGSSGAGTGGGGAGGTLPSLGCAGTLETVITGVVDGQLLTSTSDQDYMSVSENDMLCGFGTFGHAFFSGNATFIGGGQTVHATRAWVQMPLDGPESLRWFCAAAGADVDIAPTKPFEGNWTAGTTLTDLRELGPCPGAPVSGQLDYCVIGAQSGCKMGAFQGTIDGAVVASSTPVGGGAGGIWPGTPEEGATQDEALAGGELLSLVSTNGSSSGFLIASGGGPDDRAVYCIGSITAGATPGMVVLGDLSRLGTCAEAPAVEGSMTLCISE